MEIPLYFCIKLSGQGTNLLGYWDSAMNDEIIFKSEENTMSVVYTSCLLILLYLVLPLLSYYDFHLNVYSIL